MKDIEKVFKLFDMYVDLPSKKSVDGFTEDNRKRFRRWLNLYVEFIQHDASMIGHQTLSAWVSKLDVCNSSKSFAAASMAKFLHWAGYLNAEQSKMVKSTFYVPSKSWGDHTIDENQVIIVLEKLRTSAHTKFSSSRDVAIMFLMATLGVRVGQIEMLNVSDVEFIPDKNGYMFFITRQKDNTHFHDDKKDPKFLPATYSLGKFVAKDIIEDYLNKRLKLRNVGDALFITETGNRYSRQSIHLRISNSGKAHNIKIHPHALRHFVGRKIADEMGIGKAAILLGHRNISITRKYINPEMIDILQG